ncbi:unnamed protein product [Phyllotreta striolata]|uniref:C2H2-type domain-containing protein n=1 Tax=Phyllotreta striolata TaxID=444603 RepID=A0A9N9TRT5_PHYSR|nr:unnamed protein product [Phyllotreta striolata]
MKFVINENVKNFYPTPDECRVNNKVMCTEEGCNSVFRSESNLNLHVVKTHQRLNLSPDAFQKRYYCPEPSCAYNKKKFFKELKILRNHYMLQHMTKELKCDTCDKMFCSKTLSRHSDYCGVEFACPVCKAAYPMYETLQSHARRKKHTIPNKIDFKLNRNKTAPIIEVSKNKPILPKTSLSTTTFSQESQTYNNNELKYKSKMTQVRQSQLKQSNKYTQIGSISGDNYLTVETQTIGDYYTTKKPSNTSLKTSGTATEAVEAKTSSCNTSFTAEDFLMNETETNNTSTQTGDYPSTNSYSSSTNTHNSIYTDTSDLLDETLNLNIGGFECDNCHMETQTDFIFDDMLFECDFMSSMHTQTSDQILDDLVFSHIQTQTAFNDMLKSVESQTVMSRRRPDVGDRDMMHTETQTDMEFREMLEVINS